MRKRTNSMNVIRMLINTIAVTKRIAIRIPVMIKFATSDILRVQVILSIVRWNSGSTMILDTCLVRSIQERQICKDEIKMKDEISERKILAVSA